MARRESQVVVTTLTYTASRGVGRVREDQLVETGFTFFLHRRRAPEAVLRGTP